MRLPAFLRKPRWLSKDAATRRVAVEHDRESELLAQLPALAREDADPGVRLAALRRIADPGMAQRMARDDGDAGVRAQARALWIELLTGTHAAAPPLAERRRLLKAVDESDLLEHVARRAPEAELRRDALERVTRPSLLLERALEDADPGIRLALLGRIDDETQLARIAERARKSDKALNRAARERIEALRIARGDAATLEARARALCEQLEQLLREPAHADAEAEIAARWGEIEARLSEPLRARYATAQRLLVASREPPAAPAEPVIPATPAEPTAAEDAVDAAEAQGESPAPAAEEAPSEADDAPAPVVPPDAVIAPLLAQVRFAASLDEANAQRKLEREQQRALQAELEPATDAFVAAVEAGHSADAHAAKARLDELRKRLDAPLPRALAQRIGEAESRYAELSRWQHWADNQRRHQLCEEIEALPASGLHPDALATRVRDARAEWARLDAAENRPAGGGAARRFHAACRNALAPTQAYFRKRQELRETHAQELASLLERAEATLAAAPTRSAAAAARREVAEALRGLDRVEPRERKPLAQRLRDHLSAFDARIAQLDGEVENAKARLIAEAEALSQGELQRGTAAIARELQQRWQQAGNGRRSRDQAQWQAFRGAIDAAFARLDAARAERVAQDASVREQAEALCAELEALAAAPEPADRGAPARLRAAFDALRVAEPALLRRFENAQARLREAAERAERARRQARFTAWQARYRVCRAAETAAQPADVLRAQWQDTPPSDIAADALARRFDGASAADAAVVPASDDACRDVLVELETLAGLESPVEDRERRRARQLERLSARLGGGAASDTAQDLAALLVRWSELGAAPHSALDARLERALAAALDALP
ncbi:MAG: DUF349 domain-containing protein [Rhodanobacteraceae bacterium]|jgi:hypothetical protein|nr:DUF349 domain-containing protein [Rhodanobacteraceae bacterium]